jgi:hypothetical protein
MWHRRIGRADTIWGKVAYTVSASTMLYYESTVGMLSGHCNVALVVRDQREVSCYLKIILSALLDHALRRLIDNSG